MKARKLLFVLPNLFTVSSIFCGFYALTLCSGEASPGHLYQAALAIFFGIFFDGFDGRVARVHVKEGQGVGAGAPVVDLVGTGTPKARLNVPSNWISWLKPGAHLDATIDETGQRYQLTVTRLSGRVDAVSQTIEIEADFTGDTSRVLPGMSGRAAPGKG